MCGSDNVFADLGFAHPEEELMKAQFVREIRDILKRRLGQDVAILVRPKSRARPVRKAA